MQEWPRISIITPTLNQADFIEATIRSVLDQNYPDLEYIIIDGGSSDGTVDIIKKYENQLAYWVSESDEGQSNAINKGIRLATGEIIAYLNSDDRYYPGTLEIVRLCMTYDKSRKWLSGAWRTVNLGGEQIAIGEPKAPPNKKVHILTSPWGVPQPACFWRRELFEHYGLFREDMHYVFDTDFQVRLAMANELPIMINLVLAEATVHEESKTGLSLGVGNFWREDRRLMDLYGDQLAYDEKALGHALQWVEEIGCPEPTGRPRPTFHEYLTIWRKYRTTAYHLTRRALLRKLGIMKWKSPKK